MVTDFLISNLRISVVLESHDGLHYKHDISIALWVTWWKT